MRIKVLAFAASLFLISNCSAGIPQTPTTTTTAPQRDPQAVALLQQTWACCLPIALPLGMSQLLPGV
jgi:hypothetical protein